MDSGQSTRSLGNITNLQSINTRGSNNKKGVATGVVDPEPDP